MRSMPTVTTRWGACLIAASAAASSASFMIMPPWMLPALLASVTPIQCVSRRTIGKPAWAAPD